MSKYKTTVNKKVNRCIHIWKWKKNHVILILNVYVFAVDGSNLQLNHGILFMLSQ